MKPNDLSESATLVAATLPPQTISEDVLSGEVREIGEASIEDVRRRVANALALVERLDSREQWAQAFYRAQVDGFIPGGRINSAAGTEPQVDVDQLLRTAGRRQHFWRRWRGWHLRCAESGGGDDAARRRCRLRLLADSPEGCAGERHGEPRERADLLHARSSTRPARRSNPQARAVARRWACCAATIRTSRNSSTPSAKVATGQLQHVSGGHRSFMAALLDKCPEWDLVHAAEPTRELLDSGMHRAGRRVLASTVRLPAADLWQQIMQSTYDHAEPGVLFIDAINRDNNLAVLRAD